MTIEPQGILHFTIGVTDLDRASDFYQNVVGCKLVRVNKKNTMAFMSAGNDYFVLTNTGRHVRPNDDGDTVFHHSFIVKPEDYDKAVSFVESHDIETMVPIGKLDQHNTFPGRHIYFYDPDGNGVEITECTGPAAGL
ncbi:MAG: VOC family protein [Alphaproteobacteria bacterium]|jgi:catechol 2,3-dioxygenase-like lactoylglutathione lyase family enzyme